MSEREQQTAETDHMPVEVWSVDGMPFVRCSCDLTSGSRPQSAVWLREHWQGTQDDGVAALRAVVARQAKESRRG
jgi:hypothetical protein